MKGNIDNFDIVLDEGNVKEVVRVIFDDKGNYLREDNVLNMSTVEENVVSGT